MLATVIPYKKIATRNRSTLIGATTVFSHFNICVSYGQNATQRLTANAFKTSVDIAVLCCAMRRRIT